MLGYYIIIFINHFSSIKVKAIMVITSHVFNHFFINLTFIYYTLSFIINFIIDYLINF